MSLVNEIRGLLLQTKQPGSSQAEVSKRLSSILISNSDGVMKLIEATLDPDPTSQKATTHNQRCQAIATIVTRMPNPGVAEEIYYQRLVPQLLKLLKVEVPKLDPHEIGQKIWKTAAFIAVGLNVRSSDLTKKHLLDLIYQVIQSGEPPLCETPLSIDDCILIVHRLLICRFPISKFNDILPNMFFIRAKISRTQSHLKPLVDTILAEYMNRKCSVYIFEDALFNHLSLYDKYCIKEITAKSKTQISVQVAPDSVSDNLLEKVDDCTQLVVALTKGGKTAFVVDLFLQLTDRLSLSSPSAESLLLCALLDSLQEAVSSEILTMPSKAIQFVVNTLERISHERSNVVNIRETATCSDDAIPVNDAEEGSDTKLASLSLALQIVNQLLNKKAELDEEDFARLIQCESSLQSIELDKQSDQEIQRIAKDLREQLGKLGSNRSGATCEDSLQYKNAIKDLNDEAMCVRAHGLITLRRLILSKNSVALRDLKNVGLVLEASLSDPESYIYLAAIKALAALAIVKTDDILPILCGAFLDQHRSIQERLNVGEVLVQLSKNLGELTAHYARKFLHCFLVGAKDGDPAIRVSSLSNAGQICGLIRFGIGSYIIEILNCIQSLLETDPSLEVKRAAVMLTHLMLNGIDKNCVEAIQDVIVALHRLVRRVYSNSLDDVLRLHAQLALDQLDRIAREILIPSKKMIRKIELL